MGGPAPISQCPTPVPSFFDRIGLQRHEARMPVIATNRSLHDMEVSLCALKKLSKVATGKQQNTSQPKFGISSFRDASNVGDLGLSVLPERTGTDVEPRCKH